jgi:hypothetical protein
VREHDEESVPVVAKLQVVEHLATKDLHRVEVAHGYAEHHAGQPVVYARDQALAILSHLTTADDVVALLYLGEKARYLVGMVLQVRVEEYNPVGLGHACARQQRFGLAEVTRMALQLQAVHASTFADGGLVRSVGGSVVHEDDLAVEAMAAEGRLELPKEYGYVVPLIECGNDYGEVAAQAGLDGLDVCGSLFRSVGDAAHTRLRMRADRIPSWSRYFATVRRAMLIPSRFNMSTIA